MGLAFNHVCAIVLASPSVKATGAGAGVLISFVLFCFGGSSAGMTTDGSGVGDGVGVGVESILSLDCRVSLSELATIEITIAIKTKAHIDITTYNTFLFFRGGAPAGGV